MSDRMAATCATELAGLAMVALATGFIVDSVEITGVKVSGVYRPSYAVKVATRVAPDAALEAARLGSGPSPKRSSVPPDGSSLADYRRMLAREHDRLVSWFRSSGRLKGLQRLALMLQATGSIQGPLFDLGYPIRQWDPQVLPQGSSFYDPKSPRGLYSLTLS
jgi:hypothetical protein